MKEDKWIGKEGHFFHLGVVLVGTFGGYLPSTFPKGETENRLCQKKKF